MLIGEFHHSMDLKGRIMVPARFRDDLGASFIVTKGIDGCLFGYSLSQWSILEEKIKEMPLSTGRDLQRFFFSSAIPAEPDKQGRVLISQELRDYASLNKDVIIIGVSGRIEIWNEEKWLKKSEQLSDEKIIEAMDKMGF